VDADVLYAFVRLFKPRRIYELGSGASSHVIHMAARANEGDNAPVEHVIFDPFPFGHSMGPVGGASVKTDRAEHLDASIFDVLEAGDFLFIDTTHTVKTGGDVTHIFLDIVPRVGPGVLVHIHDIFLPYEYPKDWVITRRRAWAEQYLLQTFLAFNDQFEVLMPNYAVARAAPDVVSRIIPSFDARTVRPGGFWISRTQS
jgi:hypothetical protein